MPIRMLVRVLFTLANKIPLDAMKFSALEVERLLAGLADSFLSCAQR